MLIQLAHHKDGVNLLVKIGSNPENYTQQYYVYAEISA